MTLTEQQNNTIQKFRQWMVVELGANPPFDCRVHNDAHGNTLIDAGQMNLQLQKEEWWLIPLDTMVLIRGAVLEQVLLEGLYYAIKRTFVSTYKS
jgi:hypothetical protein